MSLELEMLERWQRRRITRHAIRFLREHGGVEGASILASVAMLDAFVDECVCIQCDEMGGVLGDAIAKLIESFVNDPEKWIRVITLILNLFA